MYTNTTKINNNSSLPVCALQLNNSNNNSSNDDNFKTLSEYVDLGRFLDGDALSIPIAALSKALAVIEHTFINA